MNDRKICFITCVNDELQYEECLYYIGALDIPEGYQIDTIAIRNAASIFEGYNKAMASSNAKYKVYIHQDVLIVNKMFIHDILNIFSCPQVGLIGAVGARYIPENGVWWESKEIFGRVFDSHTGSMGLLAFKQPEDLMIEVAGVDGLVMITQYDVKWRDDILNGWHYYDLSQSMEFIAEGYLVVVPKCQSPWFVHDCGVVNIMNGFDQNRVLFLKHYKKAIIQNYNRFLNNLPQRIDDTQDDRIFLEYELALMRQELLRFN
ncbi:glycosyltransferase family protein [Cohnella sp. CFH 77786]|uniref:glycosyltransferase family protein n=1 Tax=Cohnella sp. CFH 77786 TaxID=2662265 RepID=UPI001C6083F5